MVGFGKLTDRPIAANGFNMIDLKMLLDDLYRGATENTGNEPSVSVFHRAFNELKSYVLRMESKLAELEKLEPCGWVDIIDPSVGMTEFNFYKPEYHSEFIFPVYAKSYLDEKEPVKPVAGTKAWDEIIDVAIANSPKPAGAVQPDELPFDTYETELKIQKQGSIISDDFVIESPDVIVSNAKALKQKNEQISKQSTEITHLKNELEALKAKLAELSSEE